MAYTQPSNNTTAATVAQGEKYKTVRTPNWTKSAFAELLYILLLNQNGSL